MVIVGGENICPREIKERDGRLNAAQAAGAGCSAVLVFRDERSPPKTDDAGGIPRVGGTAGTALRV
jgi:hypothetical protein